jgi:integrase
VKNYLSGVKTWGHILNFNIEAFSSSELKLTLRGLNNCNKHVPRSKLPLLPVHLMKIVQLLDIYDLLDACLWSFMTMAFFDMLRASNLISRTPYCFNLTEQLIRRCVIFTKEGMLLHLLWSKTRQGHDYIHELSICRSSELLLCPVKAYCHFISLVPGGGDDPVFAVPVKGKLEPVSKHALLKRFREMLLLIDLDPASYSFHSLRHGGATLAAKAGVPEALLKHHRDW